MIDLKEFAEKWSFLKDKTVFIACSGGVDSIVLAALVKTFCKNIILLHVNYNLREQESIEDALFVEEFAKENQLLLEIKSVDTNHPPESRGLRSSPRCDRVKVLIRRRGGGRKADVRVR